MHIYLLIRDLQLTSFFFFFFNDTATTEIYTLSLHDALPICWARGMLAGMGLLLDSFWRATAYCRSEEHTSELQSHSDLVCRLLLEKKKTCYCATITANRLLASSASFAPTDSTTHFVRNNAPI